MGLASDSFGGWIFDVFGGGKRPGNAGSTGGGQENDGFEE